MRSLSQISFLVVISVAFSMTASAATTRFEGCRTDLIKETFITCLDGEAGSPTPCGFQSEVVGTLQMDMIVNRHAKTTSGRVRFRASGSGSPEVLANLNCVNRDIHYMSCISENEVSEGYKLTAAFNIHGIDSSPGTTLTRETYFLRISLRNRSGRSLDPLIYTTLQTADDCERQSSEE